MELKFVINRNGNLPEIVNNYVIDLYRNLFIKIYGLDIYDSFLKVANLKKTSSKKVFKEYAKNYTRAMGVLESVKNDNAIDLLLVYNEDNILVGAGRINKISDKEVNIPDIAVDMELENAGEVWNETVKYLISYLTNLNVEKMYLEIPFSDGALLVKAANLGFEEDPNDIDIEKSNTYLLNKNLKRINENEFNFGRK